MADSILQHQLEKLAADRYPLHMPGHKRHLAPAPGLSCYAWDITEIDGADDLHEADGILADAMARTAALYGARRCWYLVGGSTVGLLAGIRALAPFGSEVIAARNCHKAVYHAIELGRLTAHYLPPAGGYRLWRVRQCAARRGGSGADRPSAGKMRNFDQPDLRGRFERYCVHCRHLSRPQCAAFGGRSPRGTLPALCRPVRLAGRRGSRRSRFGGAERPQNPAQSDPDGLFCS